MQKKRLIMKIHNCEQYSEDWWSIRNGLPSGSKASCIVTSKGKRSESINDYAIELANSVYFGKPINDFNGSRYMDRGSELEPEAALDYEMESQVLCKEVGIITNDIATYCASPDRFVGDNGILEIKCLSAKIHTKTLVSLSKDLKCPSKYYAQVQMQLMISERKWCDLYLYHPDLPCKIVRNFPDLNFFEALKENIIYLNMKKKEILEVLNNEQ